MNKYFKVVFVLLISFLASCAAQGSLSSGDVSFSNNTSLEESYDSSSVSSDVGSLSSNDTSSSSGYRYENKEMDKFFNPATCIYISLNFTSESIHNMSDYGGSNTDTTRHDIYHPADISVSIDGVVQNYQKVGVRLKGNTSRRYIMDGNWFNGNFVNFTVKFNETFTDEPYTSLMDKNLKTRLFLSDLEKIYLKWNKNADSTFTKELYANYLLQEEGIMAQRVNICRLTLKMDGKTLYGFSDINYHVYEAIDNDFLKRRMPEENAKGNLYKGMGCTLNEEAVDQVGVEDNANNIHYPCDLKTNKKNADHTLFKQCVVAINTIGSVDTVKPLINQYVDVNYLLKYSAAMWVIGNPDDFRYNAGNTYFYFDSVTNKLYFIPFDNDSCFGILKDMHYDLSNSGPLDLRDFYGYTPDSNYCKSHLLWRTILPMDEQNYPVNKEWQNTYLKLCLEYATKYLNTDRFQKFTDSYALAPSQLISFGGVDNDSFITYASNKLKTIQSFMKDYNM